MKKIINNPYQVVDETLSGIIKAYPYHLRMAKDSRRALIRADSPIKGKVGICTGGGSGHIPVFLGYVGPGLLDGVSVGNVFSSPGAEDMYAATKEVNGGAGVLYLFGNYSGDKVTYPPASWGASPPTLPLLKHLGLNLLVFTVLVVDILPDYLCRHLVPYTTNKVSFIPYLPTPH